MKLVILLTILLLTKTSWSLNEHLISKFFEAKLCTIGIIFSCNPKHETLKLTKYLMLKGLRISTFNMALNFSTKSALAERDNNLAVIVDGDCEIAETVLNEASQFKYFFEAYRWLIFSTSYDDIMEKMKNIVLEINVDVTVTIPSNETEDDNQTLSKWMIYDVYNPAFKHGGDFKIENVGLYDIVAENYHINLNGVKYFKRRNMTGTLLKSVAVVTENSMSLEDHLASDPDQVNDAASRVHSVIIQNCQAFYNFTNNRSLTPSWGYLLPNGDVNGMLKELQDESADFGDAPLTYRAHRANLVDYGHGNTILKSVFVFQHPKNTFSSSKIYLRPLVETVWFTTLGFIILLVIILRIIITKQTSVLNSNPEDAHNADWSFLFLYGIGELCQQGFAFIPTFVSGKMVTFTVLVFSFLIYQFYSASIVSILLREPPRTIKTLEDLLKSSLEVGCEDIFFHKHYLATTTDPIAKELYNTKIQQEDSKSNFFVAEVGLKKVEQGGYAFCAQTSTIYPIVENTFSGKIICSLAEVQMQLDEFTYMIVQKRSPFRELFNYCMYHQAQVGVIKRITNYWSARKPVCLDRTNYLEISVGINESYWGLMILGCGYILAFAFLAFELIWVKEKRHFNRNIFKKVGNLNTINPENLI